MFLRCAYDALLSEGLLILHKKTPSWNGKTCSSLYEDTTECMTYKRIKYDTFSPLRYLNMNINTKSSW